MFEQLNGAIEETDFNQGVFDAMKLGQQTMAKVQEKVSIAEFEDLNDKIQENLEQHNELNDYFAEKAKEDQDELLDELNGLTDLKDLAELDDVQIGDKVVKNQNKKDVIQPRPPQPVV